MRGREKPKEIIVGFSNQGVSLGLFMGPGTAFFLHPSSGNERARMAMVASVTTMMGFGLGPLMTAVVLGLSPSLHDQLPYILLLGALLTAFGALVSVPAHHPMASSSPSLRPRIVPQAWRGYWRLYALPALPYLP